MRRLPLLLSSLAPLALIGFACSSNPEVVKDSDGGDGDGDSRNGDGVDDFNLGGGSGGDGDGDSGGDGDDDGDSIGSFSGQGCADGEAQTNLEPVYLVFLLDQSGSMGDGSYGQPEEKWDPVTEALNAFFEDPESRGLYASLSLFPNDANQTNGIANSDFDIFCDADGYDDPVVAPTELPNDTDFSSAIAAVSPPNEYGTPTYPALAGTVDYAQSLYDEGKKVAIVMVTDGEPTQCGGDNTIGNTAAEAESVASAIPTYVIGVGDELSNLNDIAAAGGTGEAFLVDLDNPAQTREDLLAQVQLIRGAEVTCDLPIPDPPAGKTLDITKVNVEFTSGDDTVGLVYSADCTDDTGWRYDDLDDPTIIELCAETCEDVKAEEGGAVNVVFGCETSGTLIR